MTQLDSIEISLKKKLLTYEGVGPSLVLYYNI